MEPAVYRMDEGMGGGRGGRSCIDLARPAVAPALRHGHRVVEVAVSATSTPRFPPFSVYRTLPSMPEMFAYHKDMKGKKSVLIITVY